METSYQLKLLSLSKSKGSSPAPALLGNSVSLVLKFGHSFTEGEKFLQGEGLANGSEGKRKPVLCEVCLWDPSSPFTASLPQHPGPNLVFLFKALEGWRWCKAWLLG